MTFKRISAVVAIFALGAAPARADVGLPELPGDAYVPVPAGAQDLAALQKRVDELLAQVKATQEGADRIQKSLDRLLNATGIRFGGEATVHSVAFQVFPTVGAPPLPTSYTQQLKEARRTWPTVGYLDLAIRAKPKPELSAEVVYRMEKVFGGYWGSLDTAGVRRFNIHGDTAIGFDLGDFNYKHTPLTVWAPADPHPYQIEPLARKRREGRRQLYLDDENTWPLQGGRLDATVLLAQTLDLALEAFGVRTAIAGTKNTSLPFAVLFPYDQYLWGVTANLSGAQWKHLSLGATYLEMRESRNTSVTPPTAPELYSNVVGGDLNMNFGGGAFTLLLESAMSNYTPDISYGNTISFTTGTALDMQLQAKGKHFNVKLHAISVEENYINYAAQTRTDLNGGIDFLGTLPTANNLLDPRSGGYGLSTVTNAYFTRYNNIIFATNQNYIGGGQQRGGVYIPAAVDFRALPYGYATPNRVGGGLEAQLQWLNGGLAPSFFGGTYVEPTVAFAYKSLYPNDASQRTYTRFGGGLNLDFGKFTSIPLALGGGWTYEATKAVTPNTIDYGVTCGDVQINWQAFKNVHLIVAWEQTSLYGRDFDFRYLGDMNPDYFIVDRVLTVTAGGLYWTLSKASDLELVYSHLDIWNPSGGPSFGSEEFEGRINMRF